MSQIPSSHIVDSHKLIADGKVDLYELTPSGGGSGVIRFKNDNPVTWLGHAYTGVPLQISGQKKTSDSGLTMPKLTIGQPDIDLSQFKGLVNDGYLDNAVIVKYTVLLANITGNHDIKEAITYRVKRVEEYGRSKIILQLATLSDSLGFSMPYRTYTPPDFPSVQM